MPVHPANPLYEAQHHAREGRAHLRAVADDTPINFGLGADPEAVAQKLRERIDRLHGVIAYFEHAALAAEATAQFENARRESDG